MGQWIHRYQVTPATTALHLLSPLPLHHFDTVKRRATDRSLPGDTSRSSSLSPSPYSLSSLLLSTTNRIPPPLPSSQCNTLCYRQTYTDNHSIKHPLPNTLKRLNETHQYDPISSHIPNVHMLLQPLPPPLRHTLLPLDRLVLGGAGLRWCITPTARALH